MYWYSLQYTSKQVASVQSGSTSEVQLSKIMPEEMYNYCAIYSTTYTETLIPSSPHTNLWTVSTLNCHAGSRMNDREMRDRSAVSEEI